MLLCFATPCPQVLSNMTDFLGDYSRQHYRQETPETLALTRHVHSYRMQLEQLARDEAAGGIVHEYSSSPRLRATTKGMSKSVADLMPHLAPELGLHEALVRLRKAVMALVS
ncbi:hypothetical protein EON62_03280, partial [archaeon]